jgi:hypothetical protein
MYVHIKRESAVRVGVRMRVSMYTCAYLYVGITHTFYAHADYHGCQHVCLYIYIYIYIYIYVQVTYVQVTLHICIQVQITHA